MKLVHDKVTQIFMNYLTLEVKVKFVLMNMGLHFDFPYK